VTAGVLDARGVGLALGAAGVTQAVASMLLPDLAGAAAPAAAPHVRTAIASTWTTALVAGLACSAAADSPAPVIAAVAVAALVTCAYRTTAAAGS